MDDKSDRARRALSVATRVHEGQVDKAGERYLGHVLRVASKFQYGSDLYVAALLHDTVEDGDFTLDDVREQFGDEIAAMVDAVTRRKDQGETYAEYVDRVKASGEDAVALKMADLGDNMDPRRSKGRKDSLLKRYARAVEVLSA